MPFLRLHINKNKIKSIVNSLRTHLEILSKNIPIKRVSSFTSSRFNASMSVEAAIVLPIFMFFIIQVMSAMNMIDVQSRLSAALHQTGNQMAFAGYASQTVIGGISIEGIASTALTEIYTENQIINYVGREYLDKSCIKNGVSGLQFDGTSIMEKNDIIEICLSYYAQPLFQILGFDGFYMSQCYYGRAWTGYDVESSVSNLNDIDPMVYITETGTVYHTNRNCTYLNLTITLIGRDEIDSCRNLSGGKYYPCEICANGISLGGVYITSQGSSYHQSINCSGLKRTIYTVPLSQVEGRRKCSKCQ